MYQRIPLRFIDVALARAVDLAAQRNIYAYDAYILVCARQLKAPLLSLDAGLLRVTRELGLSVVEI